MEQQRLQLENLKLRIQNGETVHGTRTKNGSYVVQLSQAPEMTFDAHYRATVDQTIQKLRQGVRENTVGNATASHTTRVQPILDSSNIQNGAER